MNIGIAGAGLLGRLLAWCLSCKGHAVTVFDPAHDAADTHRAAAWVAAGMLSPWAELESADSRVADLGLRSIALWSTIVSQLPQAVYFKREGSLLLAHRTDLGAAQRLIGLLSQKMPAGETPQQLMADELKAMEPSVHGPTHAWLLRGEGHIHTVQAMHALAAGATQKGARWCWNHTVKTLAPGALDGVKFDHVFDVRGVGARPACPVRGVRGEILLLHARGLNLHRPLRLVHPRWRVYMVPRPDDMLVVGASEIESEDRSPISVRTLLGLLSAAHSVLPELAEARLLQTQTQLRPALPNNLPHIKTQPGLTHINGLFRHGWLIGPALVEQALEELSSITSSLQ
jgi:glycine oxidase